jgi:hypothetical protein
MSKRAMIQATQVVIAFQIAGDGEQDFKDLLKMLIQIATFLWRRWQRVNRVRREALATLKDCQEAASFTVKVMAIGFSALAFGMGVKG